jgi:hypothetical protein
MTNPVATLARLGSMVVMPAHTRYRLGGVMIIERFVDAHHQ